MALKKKEKSRTSMIWLTMYGDLITSLTIFFILLFYSAMLSARKGVSQTEMLDFNENVQTSFYQKENSKEKAAKAMEVAISSSVIADGKTISDVAGVSVSREEIKITLPEPVLFESGKAKINDSARPVLRKIGETLLKYSGRIVVEGHTDDLPINQKPPKGARLWEIAMGRSTGLGPYTSNWELSGARALQVIAFFYREKIVDQSRLVARACGPSRPLVPNDSDANRSRNRRIEIIGRLDVKKEKKR